MEGDGEGGGEGSKRQHRMRAAGSGEEDEKLLLPLAAAVGCAHGSRYHGGRGAGPAASGRRGDPRMHAAVAIKVRTPGDISLKEALVRGGFVFPTLGEPGSNDRNTVDTDGVLLYQRKNQLNRRLRYLKNKKSSKAVKMAAEAGAAQGGGGGLTTDDDDGDDSSEGENDGVSSSTAVGIICKEDEGNEGGDNKKASSSTDRASPLHHQTNALLWRNIAPTPLAPSVIRRHSAMAASGSAAHRRQRAALTKSTEDQGNDERTGSTQRRALTLAESVREDQEGNDEPTGNTVPIVRRHSDGGTSTSAVDDLIREYFGGGAGGRECEREHATPGMIESHRSSDGGSASRTVLDSCDDIGSGKGSMQPRRKGKDS